MSAEGSKSLQINDTVFCNQGVYIVPADKLKYIGDRKSELLVMEIHHTNLHAKCLVVSSKGVNPYPIGYAIIIPVSVLLEGDIQCGHADNSFQSGGHLEGVKNGKKVQLDTASQGGMSVGSKHTEGGIKGSVGTEQKPIEFEGEEIILTAPVSSNPETYEFEGKKMTGREIASKINQDNGGVSFAEGGQPSCRCKQKSYQFGGQAVSDSHIINYINFMNKPVHERILHLSKQ